MNRIIRNLPVFGIPVLVLIGVITYFLLGLVPGAEQFRTYLIIATIVIGSFQLVKDTISSILEKNFALDYIAIVAIVLGLVIEQYIPAAVIVLMLAGGNALEKYAAKKAGSSLQKLKDRIPNTVTMLAGKEQKTVDIATVKVGDIIVIRKGEVIGLDGTLSSKLGLIDESTLTGEAFPVEKVTGDTMRSGTVNIGDVVQVKVSKESSESTYKKITDLVTQAQNQKTRFIRLADKYSVIFTLVTFAICALTYFFTQDLGRVLAVLVIATPCPLILATPISLIGGVNSAANKNIVIKNLAALEIISKCKTIVFDKTGTITFGVPQLVKVTATAKMPEDEILQIAEAIERNSLHPFAKSIVAAVHDKKLARVTATDVKETLGKGIQATHNGATYSLRSPEDNNSSTIAMYKGEELVGEMLFAEVIKNDVKEVFNKLAEMGYKIMLLSGDEEVNVKKLVTTLGVEIDYKAKLKPEDKLQYIKDIQQTGGKVIMVGDGINDAPALAAANVGVVYSHDEYTASTEAGDVILLRNDIVSIIELIYIANSTLKIALQSIYVGLGLSTVGMIIASFGYIAPTVGALIQELIDVTVIFNSLRSSRIKFKK